jgi:uncharacterized protein YraI
VYRLSFILIFLLVACTGESSLTSTPDFVTATLSSNLVLPTLETSTPLPISTLVASPEPTIIPIDGTTTTQLNVRTEPSTAGNSLGIVNAFSNIQIIGKENFGKWYQIVYAESPSGRGWITAAYVQLDVTAEVPVIETVSGAGLGVSGLVIRGINVRSGPGTTYESLGTLTPDDVVTVTGKDPSGAWMEIEFANSTSGKGWASTEFLQVNSPESLPVLGDAIATEINTAAAIPSTTTSSQPIARQDGDSISSPFAVVSFSPSGTRTLQVQGNVSAPEGDVEDWVQFTSFSTNIVAEVKCSNNAVGVELWNNGSNSNGVVLACGENRAIQIEPAQPYFFRIQANTSNNLQYVQYFLKLSAVE